MCWLCIAILCENDSKKTTMMMKLYDDIPIGYAMLYGR